MRTTIRKSLARHAGLVLGAGLVAACASPLLGCSAGGAPGATPAGPSDQAGSVSMKLTLPGGETLASVQWVITGPNGASTVVQQGSVNVANSSKVSFLVGNLPPGSNYVIALTGTSIDGSVNCAGSATFSIIARTTTTVSALMQCNAELSESGSAAVSGQTYNCGAVGSVAVSPSETTVGNAVALSATATGVDPGSLAYAWSAPSGSFSAASSAATNFTCTAPGLVTITLTVSDGPVPAGGSCNPLLSTATVQVQCDSPAGVDAAADGAAPTACSLGPNGNIHHVIYVQFDNTHLLRDNPNVPSDLEQMPHLLNFIRGNGTMMANDHTILISHTAGGFLTSFTGLYPDRSGQTVTNSYVRTSATGSFSFPSSFAYWTDPAQSNTSIPNMVGPDGSNVPAPWVSYTRAGCNFGAVGGANIVLENTGTSASGDVTKVFGTGSPQFAEAQASAAASSGTPQAMLAQTDLEGIAVHCALGSSVCSNGEADILPQEPGGYTGFNGLFGTKQINPILTGQGAATPLVDLAGNAITDPFLQPGFPGFNGMEAAVSLAYTAAMQEHGIPVTYAYISDAHDNHGVDGNGQTAYGPGQAGYVQQLQAYDQAFANFFARLAADGIDQTNTLFVFTVDEGDHFVGGPPTPANCDGVTIPCTYANIGEFNANIDTLVNNEFPAVGAQFLGSTAPDTFTVHGDDAPPFYLARIKASAGPVGPLSQTDPDTRTFERMAAQLTAVNPITGNTDPFLFKMADQAGMKAIHMFTTGDPARNATFAYFADADYFITDFPSSTCLTCELPSFAWNHGDDQAPIRNTWLGFVGPGVKNQADQTVFTDHTDVRPTINSILGLHDTYVSDGRVITQALAPSAYSSTLAANVSTVESLGDSYKQINAPFGPFADCILTASTASLQADDTTYASIEASITNLTSQRDALAVLIKTALDGAEFGGQTIDSEQAGAWITQAGQVLSSCTALDNSIQASDAGPADAASMDAGVDASTVDAGSPDAGTPDASNGADSSTASSDIDIYRVGDGTATLANTGNAVFLDEYTPAGVLVRSIAMPTTAASGTNPLVASGTATSEGLISRSADGHFILLTGYAAALPQTSSVVSSAALRVVGRVDAAGNVDTSTALSDFAVGNNPRSAASTDGTNLWFDGAAGGIRFATLGSSTSTELSTTVTNLRQCNLFGSQLYVSDSSGSAVRIGAVGAGLPTTSGQTIVNLPGFETAGSPYAFFFADLDGTPGVDTLYVTDDSAAPPGGVSKYSLVAGAWTGNGTVGAAADSYRGVTGVVTGTTVTLYAVRKGGSAATGGGELVSIVDASGYNGPFTSSPSAALATAAANTAFRGVALSPQP
jgi:hypothetical protein